MPKHTPSIFNISLLGRGFRPFFILAALQSVFMLVLWAAQNAGYMPSAYLILNATSWHSHEMIYGFSIAVIAGFLLTAIANWTNTPPIQRAHLAGLCALWIAGRIVMNFDLGLSSALIFIISLSFIPIFALSLARPLFATHNKRNFIFLGLLGVLWSAQICILVFDIYEANYVALMMIIIMCSLIGGRIIPLFTVNALRQKGLDLHPKPQMKRDMLALVSIILTTICLVVFPQSILLAFFAFTSALIHIIRMKNYHSLKTLSEPMLWILHIGYVWIIIGLILLGLSALNFANLSIAIHAFSAGAIGSLTLGMMVRVSLGHTGRKLHATKFTSASFVLMQIAIIFRVFGAWIMPDYTAAWIGLSAILWALCFVIFLYVYAPMLFAARPDGKTP
ncbi:MAG: NnrS family protein [Robiginitomaculum sp.]|nr:MAG: NnrS family protein [Robiginitomaculum sp.]